ncbi:MAG: hypothetical protein JWM85_3377, partial [Acidimicrobiaceae bacterium]|nr:hypothetical protein [Acidimicrobiaceae bacterium]
MSEASAALDRLSEDFFETQNRADPLGATLLGISGHDSELPDPSREGARRDVARFRAVEEELQRLDPGELDDAGTVNHAVLKRLAWGARSDLEHGLWETNVSAEGYAAPQSMVFMCVPSAVVADESSADEYLTRLRGLPAYFDAIGDRLVQAKAEGRLSTEPGVRQAIGQLEGHLGAPIEEDALANPHTRGPKLATFTEQARRAVLTGVRPAMERLAGVLRDELLPSARGEHEVGIRFVPRGEEGYRAAVRRHTTTELDPAEIHEIGLECVARLKQEWSELGAKVLGTSDVPAILARLREDPSLRFTDSSQIVDVVSRALERAEAARDG